MLRELLLLAASAPLCACSASLRRGVSTTEAATALEQVTRSSANELDPAVSPDGTAIAYEVATTADARPHVEVMTLATGSRRVEYTSNDVTGFQPAWMRDGSAIVFVSDAGGSPHLVQTAGGGLARPTFLGDVGNPNLPSLRPAPAPDGSTLAMSLGPVELFRTGWRRATPVHAALAVSDVRGAGLSVLGEGTDPAWSPDGKRIVFVRVAAGHAHLFVARADGSEPRQITDGSDDDASPSFSPDGRYIVYCSTHRTELRWTQANLFVVRDDGSGLVQLTEGDRDACRPDWAPDGSIYFHADATDRFHIWRLRPVGDMARQ
jgi:Tol biopolymer transport system component